MIKDLLLLDLWNIVFEYISPKDVYLLNTYLKLSDNILIKSHEKYIINKLNSFFEYDICKILYENKFYIKGLYILSTLLELEYNEKVYPVSNTNEKTETDYIRYSDIDIIIPIDIINIDNDDTIFKIFKYSELLNKKIYKCPLIDTDNFQFIPDKFIEYEFIYKDKIITLIFIKKSIDYTDYSYNDSMFCNTMVFNGKNLNFMSNCYNDIMNKIIYIDRCLVNKKHILKKYLSQGFNIYNVSIEIFEYSISNGITVNNYDGLNIDINNIINKFSRNNNFDIKYIIIYKTKIDNYIIDKYNITSENYFIYKDNTYTKNYKDYCNYLNNEQLIDTFNLYFNFMSGKEYPFEYKNNKVYKPLYIQDYKIDYIIKFKPYIDDKTKYIFYLREIFDENENEILPLYINKKIRYNINSVNLLKI